MYAIIRAGGKQQKVAPGDVIEIERIKGDDAKIEFTPIMVVDDKGNVNAGASNLDKAKVTAEVLGETKGDKIQVLKFRNKTGYRRRAGHRQRFTTIQISEIALGDSKGSSSKDSSNKIDAKKTDAKPDAKKAPAKKSTSRKSPAKNSASKSSDDKE